MCCQFCKIHCHQGSSALTQSVGDLLLSHHLENRFHERSLDKLDSSLWLDLKQKQNPAWSLDNYRYRCHRCQPGWCRSMQLSKTLFEGNPKSITVKWIDFYR